MKILREKVLKESLLSLCQDLKYYSCLKKNRILILGRGRQANYFLYNILKKFKKIEFFLEKDFTLSKNNNYKNLIKKLKINTVIVANSTRKHFKIISKLFFFKINIICEKPFTSNLKHAKKLYLMSKNFKRFFFVNYQFRFEKFIILLKKNIDKNKYGEIKKIKIFWHTSFWKKNDRLHNFKSTKLHGGVLKEYGSHVIDYLTWIFGNDIEIKNVVKKIKFHKRLDANNVLREVTGEDSIKIDLLINKIICTIDLSRASNQNCHKVEVLGGLGRYRSAHVYPFLLKNLKIEEKIGNKIKYLNYRSAVSTRELSNKLYFINYFNNIENSNSINNLANFYNGFQVHRIINLINKF